VTQGDALAKSIHLELLSDPAQIAPARRAVEVLAASCGFDQAGCDELGLVVNEALANVIRHAYHGEPGRPIVLDARGEGDTIHLELRDWGDGRDPLAGPLPERDPLRPGGLGLICLRQMLDGVESRPQPDGMLLRMTRRRDHASRPCGGPKAR
jgi:serine/threonine-protein kinase RsbW